MIKTLFALIAVFAFVWTPMGRAADPAAITGKWHFVLDTEGGDRIIDSIFQQDGDKVTGKWDVSAAKANGEPVAGTFADKQLNLEFEVNSDEVGPGTMKIKAVLADDGSLSGSWGFQTYSGTFKATRLKDEPAK